MQTPLQTLHILPDLNGRRFTQVSLGADRVAQIRDEFSLLRTVAAAACGVAPEALTREHLLGYQAQTLEQVAPAKDAGKDPQP